MIIKKRLRLRILLPNCFPGEQNSLDTVLRKNIMRKEGFRRVLAERKVWSPPRPVERRSSCR